MSALLWLLDNSPVGWFTALCVKLGATTWAVFVNFLLSTPAVISQMEADLGSIKSDPLNTTLWAKLEADIAAAWATANPPANS
jgi:hypothetical protein